MTARRPDAPALHWLLIIGVTSSPGAPILAGRGRGGQASGRPRTPRGDPAGRARCYFVSSCSGLRWLRTPAAETSPGLFRAGRAGALPAPRDGPATRPGAQADSYDWTTGMRPGCDQGKTTEGVTTTAPNGTTSPGHRRYPRHPAGARFRDKIAEAGFFASRDFLDLDCGVSKQREGGITLSMASNGGEVIDGRGKDQVRQGPRLLRRPAPSTQPIRPHHRRSGGREARPARQLQPPAPDRVPPAGGDPGQLSIGEGGTSSSSRSTR